MKKFFRFVLKFFISVIMICYVLIGISASFTLYKMEMNARQSISDLSSVIQAAIDEGRPGDVFTWVHLRPLAETAALIDIITPESGKLNPDIFFEISSRQIRQGLMEDALFWSQLGRYRLRYDALRCGAPDSVETLSKIMQVLSSPKLQNLLQQHPELVKKSLKQVLDFDAKYPANNSPASICATVNKITKSNAPQIPREQWGRIRLTLRAVAEQNLKEMDGQRP
ncbi:MAG: hypothetical protein K8R48_08060 [Alphaproteobacteria bacterium]|nr:hypothetical protein [Alphaproteobacteria bacterium]